MAQKRVIRIDLPELDRSKDDPRKHLTTGKCRLTLETDKAYSGGVDCTAQVSWIDERGFGTMALGIGGGGDFSRTYTKIKGPATQKKIDTLHADVFTPDFIESIKSEVRTYYAPNPEQDRREEARRRDAAAMGSAVKELTDSGIDASTALRMLNID
jgi:hypothetical protein